MLLRLSSSLRSRARGWLVLALIGTLVAWEIVTLPWLQTAPGGAINPLDARFFYTPSETFDTIAAYGDAASFWIRAYLTWDIVNPLLYSLAFSLGISWLFERGFRRESWMQSMNLIPLGAGLLDLVENASIVTLLAVFPAQPVSLAWLATLCTVGKVTLLGASAILLVVGVVAAVVSKGSGPTSARPPGEG